MLPGAVMTWGDAWSRAKDNPAHKVTVRLDPDDMAYCRKRAKELKLPLAEVIRTYVVWAIEQETNNPKLSPSFDRQTSPLLTGQQSPPQPKQTG